jgi:hypothetical protein
MPHTLHLLPYTLNLTPKALHLSRAHNKKDHGICNNPACYTSYQWLAALRTMPATALNPDL